MKNIHAFFVVFTLSISSSAQITFQKTVGDIGLQTPTDIHQTLDGGFIIDCNRSFANPGSYLGLIKLNAYGDTLWTKTYLIPGYANVSLLEDHFVEQTLDGGFIMAGTDSGVYAADVYLIKTDSVGDTIWTKSFIGANWDVGGNVQQTPDGGYIVTGSTGSFGSGNLDVFLIKTDANGDTLWTRVYGGPNLDAGRFVQQTNDGGYIVAGYTWSFGAGDFDAYIIKTDSAGDTLWTRTYGWVNREFCFMIRQTMDENYVILFGGNSMMLTKIDSSGNIIWVTSYYGSRAYSFQETSDLGFIIVGTGDHLGGNFIDDICLVKTDVNGVMQWTRTFGGNDNDNGYSVDQTSNGGYCIAGTSRSFTSIGEEIYIIKTDSLGNSACNHHNPQIIVPQPPNYQAYFTATVVGNANFTIGTPNIIIGHIDSIATLCSSVGIHEPVPEKTFLISPNPASSSISIHLTDDSGTSRIEIYNSLGVKMRIDPKSSSGRNSRRLLTVDCRHFPSGMYFVKVHSGEGDKVQKLIIE